MDFMDFSRRLYRWASEGVDMYESEYSDFHGLVSDCRPTPVSSTRKLISSSFHRLDMTLAVAEALAPNKPNQTYRKVSFSRVHCLKSNIT